MVVSAWFCPNELVIPDLKPADPFISGGGYRDCWKARGQASHQLLGSTWCTLQSGPKGVKMGHSPSKSGGFLSRGVFSSERMSLLVAVVASCSWGQWLGFSHELSMWWSCAWGVSTLYNWGLTLDEKGAVPKRRNGSSARAYRAYRA